MEHNIWNPKMECADRETIRQMQLEGLKKTVKTCYERVPLYKKKFDAIGLRPEHIKTLKDIRHIPFTTSDDLKENYPFGMFAVDKGKGDPPARLIGDYRQAQNCGIYPQRYRKLVGDCGAGNLRGGRNSGGYCPDFLWLWPVYRRFWPALRHGKGGRNGGSGFQREHGTPADAHAGSGVYHSREHAGLRPLYGGCGRENRRRHG